MPLIKTYEATEATGELKALYDEAQALFGFLGNTAKLLSASPEILRQKLDSIKYYMNHPTLSKPLLASIRILISGHSNCEYCIGFNTGMLVNMAGWTLEQVQAMRDDIDQANLPPREIAMLKFVVKAVHNAHEVNADDMDALRKIEWSDKDILDAVNHGANMLATDVLFNAFKIEKDF